ncbi:MAG: GNAT family N-acetyltransferase [Rhodoblastus sp.]
MTSASVVADGIGPTPGFSGFVLSRRAADEAEILTIAVAPGARGAGLATALLGNHLSRLARLGVSNLFLEVDESNRPALALYRRYGFEQVGRRPAYYAKPDGARTNALILKSIL